MIGSITYEIFETVPEQQSNQIITERKEGKH